MRASLVRDLIVGDSPLDSVFRVLSDEIWSAESFATHLGAASLDQYLVENEHTASAFERDLWGVYADVYHQVELPATTETQLTDVLSLPAYTLVIFDGLSLREAPAVIAAIREAAHEATTSYLIAPVPSETSEFARRSFGVSGPAQIEAASREFAYRYVKRDDWLPDFTAGERKRVVWVLYPDNVFNLDSQAVNYGQHIVAPVQRILATILRSEPVLPLVVTGDHGYIWQGGSTAWPVGEEEARILAAHFKAGRSTDAATAELVHSDKVWLSGTRAAARGRFAWGGVVKGATRLFKHGGVSLMESLVPWIAVLEDGADNGLSKAQEGPGNAVGSGMPLEGATANACPDSSEATVSPQRDDGNVSAPLGARTAVAYPRWMREMAIEQERMAKAVQAYLERINHPVAMERLRQVATQWESAYLEPIRKLARTIQDSPLLDQWQRFCERTAHAFPLDTSFAFVREVDRLTSALAETNRMQFEAVVQAGRRFSLPPDLLLSQSVLRQMDALRRPLMSEQLAEHERLRALVMRPVLELQHFAELTLPPALAGGGQVQIRVAEKAVERGMALTERGTATVLRPLRSLARGTALISKPPATLPLHNILVIHQEEILTVVLEQGEEGYEEIALDSLPSVQIHKAILGLQQVMLDCNRLCARAGMDEPFPPTNDIVEAIAILPNLIAVDASTLKECVGHLYKLIYEGSGDAKRILSDGAAGKSAARLTDGECQVLWDLKHIRNHWLEHDVEHGSESEIRRKQIELGELLTRIVGKTAPIDSSDFTCIQLYLARGLARIVRRLRELLIAKVSPDPKKDEGE